jgi:hypothetical protein
MYCSKLSIKEATRHWVNSFETVRTSTIDKLNDYNEITPFIDEEDLSLPKHGTMWAFTSSLDIEWLEDCGGLEIMGECGFRIYTQENYGYIFGIDSMDYNFYKRHWVPLYKKRNLKLYDDCLDVA